MVFTTVLCLHQIFKKNHVLYETVLNSIIKHSHMSITNANLYLSCILKRKKDNYGKRVHKTCWSVISMLRLFLEPFWQCGIVLCSVIVCSLYVWYRMNLQMKWIIKSIPHRQNIKYENRRYRGTMYLTQIYI